MMLRRLAPRSFPGSLARGSFILMCWTTSARWRLHIGARALSWIKLAWSHVIAPSPAARSLLAAEEQRLTAHALLLNVPILLPSPDRRKPRGARSYLATFQAQADVDFLMVCSEGGAAPLPPCPHPLPSGFLLFESRPALLAHRPVHSDSSSPPVTVIIAGRWLDEAFLQRLASDTGAQHSVLLSDGVRLASSNCRHSTRRSYRKSWLAVRHRRLANAFSA